MTLKLRIEKIEIRHEVLSLVSPIQIAYEKKGEGEKADLIYITIIDGLGNKGFGCAYCDEHVTGETPREVFAVLKQYLIPDLFQNVDYDVFVCHNIIQKTFVGFPSAQAAAEEAIFNLIAVQRGISLQDLIRECCSHINISVMGNKKNVPIMITIGIEDVENTVADVKKRLAEGYQVIKLKVGMDYQEDIKRIRAVNSILPEGVTMLLDANQGYSYDQGVEVLQETKDCHKLTIFEQPFNAKAWDDLRRLRVGSRIPIIADESAVTVEDAVQLMEQNYIDGVNIKLMKCGGIINFLKIYKRAKELEKNIMIGCMYESNISITTGAALAFVLQLYAVDLDSGTLDFPDESIKGGAYVENGFIYISKRLSIDI